MIKTKDVVEATKMHCHFSIIFEGLWQFWAVIILILLNEIDTVIEVYNEFKEIGLRGLVSTEALWGLLAVLGVTLIVLGMQFVRWRKTWVTVDGNLIIVERNTLKRVKNTIAMENISTVNLERNLFERIVGTYRIKIDTGSMTTADKTDISLVFGRENAIKFRDMILSKMNSIKGNEKEWEHVQEAQQSAAIKHVYRYTPKDMVIHCLLSVSIFNLLIVIGGIAGFVIYVKNFGLDYFVDNILGGAMAVILIVLGAAYNLVKNFITYYDFTVYRKGNELNLRYGLIKLKNYTIPVEQITCIEIYQPVFSRLCKHYQVKLITVGVGDEDGESSNLTMAIPKKELLAQIDNLLPEYRDEMNFEEIEKQKKEAIYIKVAKLVKWGLIFAVFAAVLVNMAELPLLYVVSGWFVIILYIGLMYSLSYLTAGYKLNGSRAVLCSGIFVKTICICDYKKMQNIELCSHPLGQRFNMVSGTVHLLNSMVEIPYVENETAEAICRRMIYAKD